MGGGVALAAHPGAAATAGVAAMTSADAAARMTAAAAAPTPDEHWRITVDALQAAAAPLFGARAADNSEAKALARARAHHWSMRAVPGRA